MSLDFCVRIRLRKIRYVWTGDGKEEGHTGRFILCLQQKVINDVSESTRARTHSTRFACDFPQGTLCDAQLDVAEEELVFFLADEAVLGLGQDAHQGFFVEGCDSACRGYAADELGDQAVLLEVGGLDVVEDVDFFFVGALLDAEWVGLVCLGGNVEGRVFFEHDCVCAPEHDAIGSGVGVGGADGGAEAHAAHCFSVDDDLV